MSVELYVQCLVIYVLGVVLHLTWLKVPSLREKSKMANVTFSLRTWWLEDWHTVVGNVALGGIMLFGLSELITWKPEILSYVRWFFAFMGTFGSNIAMTKFGKFEQILNAIIDEKLKVYEEKIVGANNSGSGTDN